VTIIPLSIPADHPAYAGHFPGRPVLPGVVLLDATLRALERAGYGPAGGWEINSAKFQSAVQPGEQLTLQHDELPNRSIRFAIRGAADRAVANGTLVPSPHPVERNRGE
jgi:3-hydroxyacyl-[acyl-carrier-protein] dehydratase